MLQSAGSALRGVAKAAGNACQPCQAGSEISVNFGQPADRRQGSVARKRCNRRISGPGTERRWPLFVQPMWSSRGQAGGAIASRRDGNRNACEIEPKAPESVLKKASGIRPGTGPQNQQGATARGAGVPPEFAAADCPFVRQRGGKEFKSLEHLKWNEAASEGRAVRLSKKPASVGCG